MDKDKRSVSVMIVISVLILSISLLVMFNPSSKGGEGFKPVKKPHVVVPELEITRRDTAQVTLAELGNISIDQAFSEAERALIEQTLLKISFPLERLDKVNIMRSAKPSQIEYIEANAITSGSDITVYTPIDMETLPRMIAHELGHVYFNRLGNYTLLYQYKDIRGIPSDQSYGKEIKSEQDWKESMREDFAEVFSVLYFDQSIKVRTVYGDDILENEALVEVMNQIFEQSKMWLTYTEQQNGENVTEYVKEILRELPGEVIYPDSSIDPHIAYWRIKPDIFDSSCYEMLAVRSDLKGVSVFETYSSFEWVICPRSTDPSDTTSGWLSDGKPNPVNYYRLVTDQYIYRMHFGQIYKTIPESDQPLLEQKILNFPKI